MIKQTRPYTKILTGLAASALALALGLVFTGKVSASTAAPIPVTLDQPNGFVFDAIQWGDEWNNGYETVEGHTIIRTADGWWAYAEARFDGTLGPAYGSETPLLVGVDSPVNLTPHLRPSIPVVDPYSLNTFLSEGLLDDQAAPTYQNLGSEHVLVLLVQFANISGYYDPRDFADSWFAPSASVKDYYNEVSYGKLDLEPAFESFGTPDDGVVGWLTLSGNHPAADGPMTSIEKQNLAFEALKAADPYVNFSAYDSDGNAIIKQSELHIFIIVAGYEGSYSSAETLNVWGHNWWIDNYTSGCGGIPPFDGMYVGCAYNGSKHSADGGYSMIGERHGTARSFHKATIGIMVHELGHDLGNPDLYDTVSSNGPSEGVGVWSVMGSGSWNLVHLYGDSPAHFDPFLKSYMGWLTPVAISGTVKDAPIAQSENHPEAFQLGVNPNGVDWEFYSKSGSGEYFLLENRQKTSYDAGLPGCGLLIWHINEATTYMNTVNGDENHPMVWLEQADGLNNLAGLLGSSSDPGNRGDAGDPWPGSTHHQDFNNGSLPSSLLYSGSDSQVVVHVDNQDCKPTMVADLNYISGSAPAAFAKQTSNGMSLSWSRSSGASQYEYCLDDRVDEFCSGSWTSTSEATTVLLENLDPATTYEWHVRAVGSQGAIFSDAGSYATFTTHYSNFVFIPAVRR